MIDKVTRYKYYFIGFLGCMVILCCLMKSLNHKNPEDDTKEKQKVEKQKALPDNPMIRVLLKTSGYTGIVHPEIILSSSQGLIISAGESIKESEPGEGVVITPADSMFQLGSIRVKAKDSSRIEVQSLKRGYGIPSYRGEMELICTTEGIVLINELPLEEYLYGVVPSEMPASYEVEALKAQAICARSYAYIQCQNMAYPEYQAYVDDSTSFQVYGNSQEQETSNEAVNSTINQKIWYHDQVVKAYYYSTSCGVTTDVEAWGTSINEENNYLQSMQVSNGERDYEAQLPWYRWKVTVPCNVLHDLIEINTQTEIGNVQNIEVTKQGAGNIVQEITATGDQGVIIVDNENKVRAALGGEGYVIEKQDGNNIPSTTLLPSAFFTIEKKDDTYILLGGGFGHGIGMSQNGANEMAKQGKNYQEILKLFYSGIDIK